ncbi:MAG: hypothetical protein IT290_10745 [Deltaproteobacteria bacterium]|nr:hypothetical protein [Deltaproteobacteria bacterium]
MTRPGLGLALPFRVRLVRTEEQLARAVSIRQVAYNRHLPGLAQELLRPEREDFEPGTVILLAESKLDGSALGTLRIQTNLSKSTEFEDFLPLPKKYQGKALAHIARLGVAAGKSTSLIKLALFKAMHRFCLANQISYLMVVGAPPRDRWYDQLGFEDIFEHGQLFLLPSSHGIPGRMMSFEVATAERRWRESSHPLYDFMFVQYTPDIDVFSSLSGAWVKPRAPESAQVVDNHGFLDLGILAV